MSRFDKYRKDGYPFRFRGRMKIGCLVGGIPGDPKVAAGWLRAKLADKDDLFRERVAEVMLEREIAADEAAEIVQNQQHLNGFKRAPEDGPHKGQLFIEGRQLKAALKEAAMVAANAGKITTKGWGSSDDRNYRKGIKAWFPEHVFVVEDRLYLTRDGQPVMEPSGVMQRFVHTTRGNSIQYEEFVENAEIEFTIITDYPFKEKDWAMIWLTGEKQGIGATRSQGFGTYAVTEWEEAAVPRLRSAA